LQQTNYKVNKLLPLAVLACCIYITACTGKRPGAEPDRLSFSADSFKLGIAGCTGDSCANASFYYPVFTGKGAKGINQFVEQLLSAPYMDTTETDYKAVAKSFIEDFEKEKVNDANGWGWELDRTVTVDTILPEFITLHLTEYMYAGGAHPNSYDSYAHLHLKTNNRLSLTDFLVNGDTTKVWEIAGKQFRKNFKLSEKENLEEAGFFFTDGIFSLSSNIFFNKNGIVFHYNNYEIRSYAEGPYDLEIPYAALDGLLKKELLQ
jgi:hypothetical protein